jgi:hypothetical protein
MKIEGWTNIIIIIIIIIIKHLGDLFSYVEYGVLGAQERWNMCNGLGGENNNNNCKQKFTKISGNNTRTALNRFPTKNCHTRNITHHKESATS